MANDIGGGPGGLPRATSAERVHAGVHLQLPPVRAAAHETASAPLEYCAVGITANREKCRHNLHNSLMLVTALNFIGYDNA